LHTPGSSVYPKLSPDVTQKFKLQPPDKNFICIFDVTNVRLISITCSKTFFDTRDLNSRLIAMPPTNGINWVSYVEEDDVPFVKEYLEIDGLDSGAIVKFEGLMEDTDMSKPFISNWYKLHLLTSNDRSIRREHDRWPMDVVAWGLNIWHRDLLGLLRDLCERYIPFRCGISQNHDQIPTFRSIEEAYDKLPARFPGISTKRINYQWYMSAIHQITVISWKQSFWYVHDALYNDRDGSINMRGHMYWTQAQFHASSDDKNHGFPRAAVPSELWSGGDEEVSNATIPDKRKHDGGNEEYVQRSKRLKENDFTATAKATTLNKRKSDGGDGEDLEHSKRLKANDFTETANSGEPRFGPDKNDSVYPSANKRKNESVDGRDPQDYKRKRDNA
jgi:hypothetical protein